MFAVKRINAQGKTPEGEDYLDYMINTEGLRKEVEEARQRANQGKPVADYYVDDCEGLTQRWHGSAAEELGLAGRRVVKEDLLALARGFHPGTGEPLCRNAGEEPREVVKRDAQGNVRLDKDGKPMTVLEGGHRVGYDMVLTPPKSVSIAMALAEPDLEYAIIQAHRKANNEAVDYALSKLETRRGAGGKDVIGLKDVIVMQADHMCNRNLEENLHTHNLLLGIGKGEDGHWGTFDSAELYRHKYAADQIYKTVLAKELRALGFGIEQQRELDDDGNETGRVSFEIAGISREFIEQCSSRRQEILEYEKAHGVDRQAACLATRKHKDEPNPEELKRMWADTKASIEAEHPGRVPTIAQLMQTGDVDMRVDDRDAILERLHASEAYFCEHDLVSRLAQENMGKVDLGEVMGLVEDFKANTGLVHINPAKLAEEDQGGSLSRKHTEDRFAAPWMVAWEQEVLHRVASRNGEDHQKVAPEKVKAGIEAYEKRKGFTLSSEQRNAVEYITAKSGGVAILEGAAGTGKTTTSDAYSEIFRGEGRQMIGACISQMAAMKLETESGMECFSTAKLLSMLKRERLVLNDKHVLVLDEAGMIPTGQARQLLSFAQNAGAKVIMQGDVMQLQPIEAGSAMSLSMLAVEEKAQLVENRRQQSDSAKAMVATFYETDDMGAVQLPVKGTRSRSTTIERGRQSMLQLRAGNHIDEYSTQGQAMDAMVQDYLNLKVPDNEKIMIASTHQENMALNTRVRAQLKAAGELPQSEVSFQARDDRRRFSMSLAVGDRILFTKNESRNLNVSNGEAAVVEKIKATNGGYDLSVRLESEDPKRDGRVLKFNTNDYANLNYNYAKTIHRSQGQSIDHAFMLANLGMIDNHSALVGASRFKKTFRIYGDTETIERLEERLGMERLKGNAITEGVREPGLAEQLYRAQVQRQDQEEKVQANSLLSKEDNDWIREKASAIARARHHEPEQVRTRSRGFSR